jgi:Mg-chelatase subunit ChlI
MLFIYFTPLQAKANRGILYVDEVGGLVSVMVARCTWL